MDSWTAAEQARQTTISSVVRVYMAAHKHCQADLAAGIGVSRPAVSQKLAGRIRWTLPDLDALARFYSTSAEDFLSGDVLKRLGVVVGKPGRRTLAVSGVPAPRSA